MRAIGRPARVIKNVSPSCSTESSKAEKARAASVAVTSLMPSDYPIRSFAR
jgi:hypothetical protein